METDPSDSDGYIVTRAVTMGSDVELVLGSCGGEDSADSFEDVVREICAVSLEVV